MQIFCLVIISKSDSWPKEHRVSMILQPLLSVDLVYPVTDSHLTDLTVATQEK